MIKNLLTLLEFKLKNKIKKLKLLNLLLRMKLHVKVLKLVIINQLLGILIRKATLILILNLLVKLVPIVQYKNLSNSNKKVKN